MPLTIQIQSGGPLETNSFLLVDETAHEFVIVDPTMGTDQLFQRAQTLKNKGFRAVAIWNTHGHFDHIYDNARWKTEFQIPIFAHSDDDEFHQHLREQAIWFGLPAPEVAARDFALNEGQTLQIGENQAQILELPGHSPGSIGFYFEEFGVLIGGDVLFQNSVGRTDLPGGDPKILAASLRRLFRLPDAIQVLPGHGGATTIGEEKRSNAVARQLLAQFP